MDITDRMLQTAINAYVAPMRGWPAEMVPKMRKALTAALAHEPDGHEWAQRAGELTGRLELAQARIAELAALSKDDAAFLARCSELLEQADRRIAELEAQLASIGKDMPEMLALCEHKDVRIAELEAQLLETAAIAEANGFRAGELQAQNAELQKAIDNPDLIRLCQANASLGMEGIEQHVLISEMRERLKRAREHLTDDGWQPKTFDEGRLLDILDGKEGK